MKMKYFLPIGLLLGLALLISGCSGTLAASWPGVAVDANNAYVAGGPYVYAVNLQTGTQAWRFPDKASTANPFYAAPVLTPDGQLIVGGFDKRLYSLDPKTGKSLWIFSGAHDRYIGGELVTDSTIYAPNADYNLYALDLSGNVKWTFEADQSLWGTPVSDGKNVYFGTLGRKIYAVDAQSGKQAWVQNLDGAVLGAPVIGPDGTLYAGTYGNTLYGLDVTNGKIRWSKLVASWIWAGPVLDSGALYVGDASGKLYAFPTDGSAALWTHDLSDPIVGSPLLAGGAIVVGTEKGNVYFLDAQGTPQHTVPLPNSVKMYSNPVAAGDMILVAPTGTATDPVLIALDPNGSIKWSFIPPK